MTDLWELHKAVMQKHNYRVLYSLLLMSDLTS